jgi:hypothetical protein
MFGAHCFYVDKTATGVNQLILSFTVVGMLVSAPSTAYRTLPVTCMIAERWSHGSEATRKIKSYGFSIILAISPFVLNIIVGIVKWLSALETTASKRVVLSLFSLAA